MNNNYISVLTAFQGTLEKLSNPTIDTYMSSASIAMQNSFQPLLDFQQTLASTARPGVDLINQLQARNEALIEPICRMQEVCGASLITDLYNSLINDGLLRQLRSFQDQTSSFSSALQGIQIHKSYVSVPEALIPDDFQFEEVSDTSSIALEQNAEQATNTKNLSLSNALALLNFITMILVFLLAPFYNHAIENTLSKKAETKPSEPITEEQAQQMLNYLSELTDYQQAILTTLETSHESVQESVSIPSDIDSTPSGTDSTPSNADSDS